MIFTKVSIAMVLISRCLKIQLIRIEAFKFHNIWLKCSNLCFLGKSKKRGRVYMLAEEQPKII